MPAIRVGIYYRHIFDDGGYPRDILTLQKAINGDNVEAVPITGVRNYLAVRSSLNVVHFFGMFMPDLPFVAMDAWRVGLPSVWSPLGNLLPHALRRSPNKKKLFLACGTKFAMQRANIIHAFTDDEKNSIVKLGIRTPIHKVPFGLFPEDLPSPNTGDHSNKNTSNISNYLLFLGRLDVQQKGIDVLIDGYISYLRSGGRYNLVICGKDWKQGENFVRNKILHPAAKGRIQFLGSVNNDEKFSLMTNAVAFVYPTRHDGPPRPIRDALALGKRILVTRSANIHDDIEALGWGYSFDPEPSQLAEAIAKLESETSAPNYVNPMSILSWDLVSRSFIDLYFRLTNEMQS